MLIREVKNRKDQQDFLKVNVVLFKGDSNYIRPLDKDVEEVFDPARNKAFRFGEAIRWVLEDQQGNLIGRIAAFVNKKYRTKGDRFPVGGVGFLTVLKTSRPLIFCLIQLANGCLPKEWEQWTALSILENGTAGGG